MKKKKRKSEEKKKKEDIYGKGEKMREREKEGNDQSLCCSHVI